MLMLRRLATCVTLLAASAHASITDSATGISFLPKLQVSSSGTDLEVIGAGVRKKGPIKVYSVGMYTTSALKETLSGLSKTADRIKALASLRSGAGSERPVSFMLDMNFKVGAEKMANAIADSVAPRHTGDVVDVDQLKQMIMDGVAKNTPDGAAVKGTKFQFDCSSAGVDVSVNGQGQGCVPSAPLSQAFCDVYLDDDTVSPALRDSCLDNCCQD